MGGNNLITGMAIGHMLGSDGGAAAAYGGVVDAKNLHNMSKQMKGWRERAINATVTLRAHKMSEEALIEALAKENANHPLANRDAVEKLIDQNFEKESAKCDADREAYIADLVAKNPV